MPSTSRLLLPRPAASCLAASRRRRRSSLFRWLVVAVVVLVRLSVCQSPRRAEENNIDRRSLTTPLVKWMKVFNCMCALRPCAIPPQINMSCDMSFDMYHTIYHTVNNTLKPFLPPSTVQCRTVRDGDVVRTGACR